MIVETNSFMCYSFDVACVSIVYIDKEIPIIGQNAA